MTRTTTALIGAGLLAFGLGTPLAASAHAEDNALAFVIGAAVGQALDDDRKHLRHPHRPPVVHVHGRHGRDDYRGWRGHHKGWYHGKGHKYGHWKAKRWAHYRRDLRDDRHDWRHDRRHERRHDRRDDRRHERRHDRDDRRWERRGH